MKDFTFYKNDRELLLLSARRWLHKMGLKETRWFLDTTWFDNGNEITFNRWIYK